MNAAIAAYDKRVDEVIRRVEAAKDLCQSHLSNCTITEGPYPERCVACQATSETADRLIAQLDPDLGYAEVELLFALGADCCLDAQRKDHSQCVWHHPELADALIAAARKEA